MPAMKEAFLTWSLNGKLQSPLVCSPHQGEDLLKGYLLTEGLVRNGSEINVIRSSDAANPQYAVTADTLTPRAEAFCESPLCLSLAQAENLLDALDSIPRDDGEHTALLWDGKQQVSASDISRHHALDAAVGKALHAEMDLTHCILCISARVTFEIVRKASRAGIPAVCTRKAVGSLAAEYAGKSGCVLICLSSAPACYGTLWRIKAD